MYIDSEHTEYILKPDEVLSHIEEVIEATETYDTSNIEKALLQFMLARKISADTKLKIILSGDGASESQMG